MQRPEDPLRTADGEVAQGETLFFAISLNACHIMSNSPKVAKLREVRTLHLTISEAHRLPLKLVPNPYCVISFNNVRVGKTKVKVGPDPVYDEEFELDDIPPEPDTQ